jgi:hypothetical protein
LELLGINKPENLEQAVISPLLKVVLREMLHENPDNRATAIQSLVTMEALRVKLEKKMISSLLPSDMTTNFQPSVPEKRLFEIGSLFKVFPQVAETAIKEWHSKYQQRKNRNSIQIRAIQSQGCHASNLVVVETPPTSNSNPSIAKQISKPNTKETSSTLPTFRLQRKQENNLSSSSQTSIISQSEIELSTSPSSSSSINEPAIHVDVVCDRCLTCPIVGIRFRCLDCPSNPNTNFCYDC